MKNTGFLMPVIKPEDFVLGASPLPQVILQPEGQWLDFLPEFESQVKQIETYNCTSYNTLACFEALFERVNKEEIDFSDRFLGIRAGTKPPGNDPLTAALALHKGGAIYDSMLPFSSDLQTAEEYYSYKGGNEKDCINRGKEYEETYDFGYEIVPVDTKTIMSALRYSPLGVSVRAWYQNDKGLYIKEKGEQDTHWTCLVGYKENEYWIVNDSYLQDGSGLKKLVWDYPFGFCLRYHLALKSEVKKKLTIWMTLLKDFQRLLELIGLRESLKEAPVIPDHVCEKECFIEVNKPKEVEKTNKIDPFCKSIEKFEGYYMGSRSWRNKNSGNLKFANQKKAIGKDKQGFAIFVTYEDGYEALKTLVVNACEGRSKVYSPTMTISQFFALYAPAKDKNNPEEYARYVANRLSLPVTTIIKELI